MCVRHLPFVASLCCTYARIFTHTELIIINHKSPSESISIHSAVCFLCVFRFHSTFNGASLYCFVLYVHLCVTPYEYRYTTHVKHPDEKKHTFDFDTRCCKMLKWKREMQSDCMRVWMLVWTSGRTDENGISFFYASVRPQNYIIAITMRTTSEKS